jgi:ABC-type glycerol-3-phosphate transport system substrate-binding protein
MKGVDALRALVFAAAMSAAGCGDSMTPTAPTTTTTTTSPVTVTYSTTFGPRGAAARAFTASQAGTVSVTLVSAGPPSDVALGLGVGIPRADGGGCSLAQSVTTSAGPNAQIVATVDAGNYCVRIFDAGSLTDPVAVTVTLVHP